MELSQRELVHRITSDFKEAFELFVQQEDIYVTGLVEAGFYSALEILVKGDPLPDVEVQAELERYIAENKLQILRNQLERIEFTFLEVSKQRSQSH